MDKDEIISRAGQAGMKIYKGGTVKVGDGVVKTKSVISTDLNELERFAALVAAHEREQCALVCITLGDYYAECDDFEAEDVAHACASSIRENNK